MLLNLTKAFPQASLHQLSFCQVENNTSLEDMSGLSQDLTVAGNMETLVTGARPQAWWGKVSCKCSLTSSPWPWIFHPCESIIGSSSGFGVPCGAMRCHYPLSPGPRISNNDKLLKLSSLETLPVVRGFAVLSASAALLKIVLVVKSTCRIDSQQPCNILSYIVNICNDHSKSPCWFYHSKSYWGNHDVMGH